MKFRSPYTPVIQYEYNSGEIVTDEVDYISAKDLYYRIQAGQIISPFEPASMHYDDLSDEVKEFSDDVPDLIDLHQVQVEHNELLLKIEQEQSDLEKKKYDDAVIATYLDSLKEPSSSNGSTSPAGDEA